MQLLQYQTQSRTPPPAPLTFGIVSPFSVGGSIGRMPRTENGNCWKLCTPHSWPTTFSHRNYWCKYSLTMSAVSDSRSIRTQIKCGWQNSEKLQTICCDNDDILCSSTGLHTAAMIAASIYVGWPIYTRPSSSYSSFKLHM